MAVCPTCGREYQPYGLTARELEILGLVADGLANKQIGRVLGIHAETVHNHMSNIRRKLGTANRTQSVLVAFRQGLIQ